MGTMGGPKALSLKVTWRMAMRGHPAPYSLDEGQPSSRPIFLPFVASALKEAPLSPLISPSGMPQSPNGQLS